MKVTINIHYTPQQNIHNYYIRYPEFRISTYVYGWSEAIVDFVTFTNIITYHHKRMRKYENSTGRV